MVDQHLERWPVPSLAVGQHRDIAGAADIAGREHRPLADLQRDIGGFVLFVVEAVDARLAPDRVPLGGFAKAQCQPGANHLLWRDAVVVRGERTHEVGGGTRAQPGLVALRAQMGEQLEHRLVDAVAQRRAAAGMTGGREKAPRLVLERFDRGVAVHGVQQLQRRGVAALQVAARIGEEFAVGALRAQRGIGVGARARQVRDEQQLGARVLAPQRAVVVEDGDAVRRGDEGRAAHGGGVAHEAQDRLLGGTVAPGGQRVRRGGGRRGTAVRRWRCGCRCGCRYARAGRAARRHDNDQPAAPCARATVGMPGLRARLPARGDHGITPS